MKALAPRALPLRRTLGLFLVAVGVVSSPSAWLCDGFIAPVAATETLSQDALLERGFAALHTERPREALLLFKRARFISVSARALGAMGLAEEALGHWIDAEQNLGEALSFTQDPWVRAEKETLTRALERVEKHVGSLRVVGGPPGTIVLLGDRSLAQLPMSKPVRLPVGRFHLVLVPLPGYSGVEADVDVTAGSPTELALSCPKTRATTK